MFGLVGIGSLLSQIYIVLDIQVHIHCIPRFHHHIFLRKRSKFIFFFYNWFDTWCCTVFQPQLQIVYWPSDGAAHAQATIANAKMMNETRTIFFDTPICLQKRLESVLTQWNCLLIPATAARCLFIRKIPSIGSTTLNSAQQPNTVLLIFNRVFPTFAMFIFILRFLFVFAGPCDNS